MTSTEHALRAKRAWIVAVLLVLSSAALVACNGDRPAREDVTLMDAYTEWKSDDPPIFLDVRSEAEYEQAHIEGSMHIPHTEVAEHIDELRARGEPRIIVYCERGGRARVAEEALDAAGGFEVRHMEGDMRGWRRNKLPVVRGGG